MHDPDGALTFAGGVGTGFTHAMLTQLHDQLARWQRATPPVSGVPREHARGVQWVEPLFVGEVAYRTWTPDGHLRHPSWRGLRPDRTPAEARRPGPTSPDAARDAVVVGSMRTTDGQWQVDVLRRDEQTWYRVRHDDNLIDQLTIDQVEAILGAGGVDLSALAEQASQVPPAPDATA